MKDKENAYMYLFLPRYLTLDPVVFPWSEVMIDKRAVWQAFDNRRIPVNTQNLRAIALFLQHGAGGTCLSGRLAVCLYPPWVASLLREQKKTTYLQFEYAKQSNRNVYNKQKVPDK